MTTKEQANSSTADREITIKRVLDAPISLVWEVWTNPDHIKNWWGPNGFTNTISKMDIKPGGEWGLVMHGPDGTDYKNKSVFKEVITGRKLVYEHVSAPKFTATILFEEQGAKTAISWHMLFESAEQFIQVVKTFKADEGLKQNVEKLAVYLSGMDNESELALVREFDAPRDLVFKAWTEPDRFIQWWGPKGFTLHLANKDIRPGGMLLYCMATPDGKEMWGKVVYREIVAPERIVFISSFSDKDGNTTPAPFFPVWPLEVLNLLTLTEHNGKTTLTLRGGPVKATADERAAFAKMRTGMQTGFGGTFEQLDNYLANVKK